jgi:hypothetical protein
LRYHQFGGFLEMNSPNLRPIRRTTTSVLGTLSPISALYLFAVYLTREAYLTAMGKQAPPFDPAKPVKFWFDPSPSGQPYSAFDTTAGTLITMPLSPSVAESVNIPGPYNYPAFEDTATDATLDWPYGVSGPISPATVCLYSEALAIAAAIAPCFPGQTVTVVDGSTVGVYYTVYHVDPRRQWAIEVNGKSPYGFTLYAKTLMILSYAAGVGALGTWSYAPIQGEPVTTLYLVWTATPQITVAPENAITLPPPIKALAADQQFTLVPPNNPMFPSEGPQWMVETIPPAPPAPVITLEELQADVAQYNARPGVTPVTLS